ncbi:ornithine decarboxylase [Tsukamurella sp. 8F]|uniref:aminotransferase class I/II-fold pyridoxal phosphate-dependent enzyme n=1 Tax=unclassified Tsukamurella TaxID=2633480 RepID=UPI0023BA140A|nr:MULTISPECIES: ornithine decarboxylase [unclassified Tsukamurella]MDF0528761.1 ornithine decarboxylase [Tsukamurella sp. 8J]MDF0586596.1 ornithine decarboxylase [Tsukamurella sp. 8F]
MTVAGTHAYNSVWQMRSDTWSRLEEAALGLTMPAEQSERDRQIAAVGELVRHLNPVEPYWAFPGSLQFARVVRLFNAGEHGKFARAVARINRALTTDSYRRGDVDDVTQDESTGLGGDIAATDPDAPAAPERLYFEVLVVDSLTEEQERTLRREFRNWRRADADFVYELVFVGSTEEALIAARLNVNIQAVVVRRHFHRHSTRDLSGLGDFIDTRLSVELDRDATPDQRASLLAAELAQLRPELDLYLMTEVDVESIAGRLGENFRRVFHAREGMLELHLSILAGIADRYRTPFFSALKQYSQRPTGVFHALPISQGKSIVGSHWIKDMVGFYGLDVFMAETSATCGGLDSLLEPTGPLRDAQKLASETYGSRHTYFVTNGTSTANKIVTQSLVAPGDIVLLDRNCHQSHHYGMLLAGAQVQYLEAYPLPDYSMYGAVPLREIKSKLLALKRAGKLDRVRLLSLTNCTFDGVVYDPLRVMEECLAIKPDLVFLWDEAWFAFARFHPDFRARTGMAAAAALRERLQDPKYRTEYEASIADEQSASDAELLERRLRPDPAKARVRVYATQSTHKTLTALRQGSMIHVYDQDFGQKTSEAFHEAYMAHTSTSPNYQILASLDLGRRQVALEGTELVVRQIENAMQLRDAIDDHPLLQKYMRCLRTSDMIPEEYRPSGIAQPLRSGLRNMIAVWGNDEFVLDPSRVTLSIGNTGYDGDTFKRDLLMDRYGVQINKTSRNTVLFMTNIGTTRSSVAFLVEVLVKLAREIDTEVDEMSLSERARFEQNVRRLTSPTTTQPDFSGFHRAFLDPTPGIEQTAEGDVRRAFYLSYDDSACEYLTDAQVEERLEAGGDVVSATFVTPYPPGFPVLVPGQAFSSQILAYIRNLDTLEVHGYNPELGYRVYTEKAIETALADNLRRAAAVHSETVPTPPVVTVPAPSDTNGPGAGTGASPSRARRKPRAAESAAAAE